MLRDIRDFIADMPSKRFQEKPPKFIWASYSSNLGSIKFFINPPY
jgi:hypothetical protein